MYISSISKFHISYSLIYLHLQIVEGPLLTMTYGNLTQIQVLHHYTLSIMNGKISKITSIATFEVGPCVIVSGQVH